MNEIVRRTMSLHDLKTERLRLTAMTQDMLQADLNREEYLGVLLKADLPAEWPPADWEPHVVRMALAQCIEHADTAGWHRYVITRDHDLNPTLVGCVGGFLKPDGCVELGYTILPSFQRRGFATEATGALIQWLRSKTNVRSITAQASVHKPESIKVMERCGLQFVDAGDDRDTVRYAVKT